MPTVRLPLSWPFNPRSADTAKDQHRVNVMDEVLGERIFTLKRPGLSVYEPTYTAGEGQALTIFNGAVYSVIGDRLNQSGAAASGANGSAWQAMANAPWLGRELFGIVDLNGSIYLLGGGNGLTVLSDVWQRDTDGTWLQATASAPWAGRSNMMVGVINDAMYVFGGRTGPAGTYLHDVWASKNGKNWTQSTSAAAWTARSGSGVISADNGIYLLGGESAAGYKNDVWFTVDGITWTEVTPAAVKSDGTAAWSARTLMQNYYFKNKLWVAGGYDGTNGKNDVWSSSDVGKTWTLTQASAWASAGLGAVGRRQAGAVVYNNKMWMINGVMGGPDVYVNHVYSSIDGIDWPLVTASGPWAPSYSGKVFVAPVPPGVSSYNYLTMYWVGGSSATVSFSSVVYYATLNETLALGTGLTTAVADQPMQFNAFNNNGQLLLKNRRNLWVIDAANVIPVSDNRYPFETVPGIVVLGGIAYVMDTTGLIHSCELNDPYHWPLLNVVGADYESDPGVALVKYLNYVLAFGTYTMQFFYDAGIADGSPLRPYLNANMKIGCASAETIANVGPTIVWLGQTAERNWQVMILNGLMPQVISTPAIDKLINNVANNARWRGIAAYSNGHLFYILSDANGSSDKSSFVYDLTVKQWFEWTTFSGIGPFDYAASAARTVTPIGTLLLSPFNGSIYKFDGSYNDDNGVPFVVTLQTAKVDAENNRTKFWGQTELIGDRNAGEPLVQTTDDDYQSFNLGRTVDMSTSRPVLYRNGSSRRRAWKITQRDSNAMRLEALEVTFEQGL